MAGVSNPNHSMIYNSYRALPSFFCKYHPSSKSLFPVFVVIHFLVLLEKIGRCFLMLKIKTLSFSPVSAPGHLLHSPINAVVSHLMVKALSPLGLLFTHQTLSSTACMAVSIWQSPNPPFSLPHCLNSSPTGLLAFPWEQSTGPLSKHFSPSVSNSYDKNSSPYS